MVTLDLFKEKMEGYKVELTTYHGLIAFILAMKMDGYILRNYWQQLLDFLGNISLNFPVFLQVWIIDIGLVIIGIGTYLILVWFLQLLFKAFGFKNRKIFR